MKNLQKLQNKTVKILTSYIKLTFILSVILSSITGCGKTSSYIQYPITLHYRPDGSIESKTDEGKMHMRTFTLGDSKNDLTKGAVFKSDKSARIGIEGSYITSTVSNVVNNVINAVKPQ